VQQIGSVMLAARDSAAQPSPQQGGVDDHQPATEPR
jgi:hypothetical protein